MMYSRKLLNRFHRIQPFSVLMFGLSVSVLGVLTCIFVLNWRREEGWDGVVVGAGPAGIIGNDGFFFYLGCWEKGERVRVWCSEREEDN